MTRNRAIHCLRVAFFAMLAISVVGLILVFLS
jgi:hypothetical protein